MSTDGQRHANEIAGQLRVLREQNEALAHLLSNVLPYAKTYSGPQITLWPCDSYVQSAERLLAEVAR